MRPLISYYAYNMELSNLYSRKLIGVPNGKPGEVHIRQACWQNTLCVAWSSALSTHSHYPLWHTHTHTHGVPGPDSSTPQCMQLVRYAHSDALVVGAAPRPMCIHGHGHKVHYPKHSFI